MGHVAVPAAVAPETFIAGADLSAKNKHFLAVTADNTVNAATGPDDVVIGIQDDIPFNAAGAQVGVRTLTGPSELIIAAAVPAGSFVTPNGAGKGVVATTGQKHHARAITAGTVDGDIIEVIMGSGVTP
jgi:hypothetical protein